MGLGQCVQVEDSEQGLTYTSPSHTHKLSGAVCSISDTETLSAIPAGSSPVDEDRKYDHGGVYQSSGRSAPPTVVHVVAQTDFLE